MPAVPSDSPASPTPTPTLPPPTAPPEPAATPDTGVTEAEREIGAAVGDIAPGFMLSAALGPSRSLEAFKGDKSVLLVFYRAFW